MPGDMLDAKYIDELVKKSAEFGEGKIHIIVNNAGFTWDGVIHKVQFSILHSVSTASVSSHQLLLCSHYLCSAPTIFTLPLKISVQKRERCEPWDVTY